MNKYNLEVYQNKLQQDLIDFMSYKFITIHNEEEFNMYKRNGLFDKFNPATLQLFKDIFGTELKYKIVYNNEECEPQIIVINKIEEGVNKMVKSEVKQFYIGDPCYVLNDNIYYDIWDKKFNFQDGYVEVKEDVGFEVHGTCYGDGEYKDEQGNEYPVDSGTLAVIPVEICGDINGFKNGRIVKSENASLHYKEGIFTIELDNEKVIIDTDLDISNKQEEDKDKESANIKENKLQEGYVEDEQALAQDYEKRVLSNITDNAKKAFNELKEILSDESNDTSVDGYYFPSKAVAVLENTEQYHLNGYMDLTVSDILNTVDDCDTIEEAIHELFVDYNPDSAFSWADNFVTVLDKLDFDTSKEDLEELDESKLNANDIINNFKKKVADEHIHVTEDDINEYMSDLFTNNMETEEDMDAINEAEEWLRHFYGIDKVQESKEDKQLSYDNIQDMSTEERHKLWMTEHDADFEDTEEGNDMFWDWVEEEFPIKELNESRPDKEYIRHKMFRDSRRKLDLKGKSFTTKEEVLEYLEKCENDIDIMNINNRITNTDLRNYMLDLGFDFTKEVGKYPSTDSEEFKQYMIDGISKYETK